MPDVTEQAAFEQILEYLRQTRGFDFTAYKRTSLMRRVLTRMHAADVRGFESYLQYLQVRPEEFGALFNTILINVTAFFRDQDVWDTLASDALPPLLSARQTGEPLRIWSAGCAAGQEAYSAAIVIAETIGVEAFKERVRIYATDVDEEALREARQAVYHPKHVAEMSEALREKYFERNGDSYVFRRDLRRSVIFGRHDLIQDAPIPRLDLLLCRNTLMYFTADTQARIMGQFISSMKAGGLIVLGRAEMLFTPTAMFVPVDLKRRIFKTVPRVNDDDRPSLLTKSGREDIALTAYEQLQFTSEELKTTNEALQSIIEELETTNRELRSTNEELDAMKRAPRPLEP